ncbi:DUF2946 family protein [Caenimonas aquaedulcis]|uniref:DUF2946 domain-containing protein n=1 Tax=Caenimonas aquaedulcis TaxID=2793270 RepID=A0A931H5I6_9BURK|nr:DUF2946 family protein [Caenimonas aquaedulcis]MBG9388800.1 hypothetical protein [Caenimonas aquaedulcis]
MQALRNAAFLARLVLAWFALSIGIAVAAPVVHPQGVELICSAGGTVKMMAKGEPGNAAAGHTLDCPLCAPSMAPPVSVAGVAQAQPLGHSVQSIPAARIAALTAPALPARGPPHALAI